MRDDASPEPATRIRLIESWLPLAQEINTVLGLQEQPTALEDLIVTAAPALTLTSSVAEARAVLWHYFIRQRTD